MTQLEFIRKRVPFVSPIQITIQIINILKNKIAELFTFSVDPSDLQNATDENFDTSTTWGTGVANDKSAIRFSIPLTYITKVVYKVGVRTDNPELNPDFVLVVRDKDGAPHELVTKTISTTDETIFEETINVNFEIDQIQLNINQLKTAAVCYIRVYEVQAFR
jgi:hypothetical protein